MIYVNYVNYSTVDKYVKCIFVEGSRNIVFLSIFTISDGGLVQAVPSERFSRKGS